MLSKIRSGFFQRQGFIASDKLPISYESSIIVPKYNLLYTKDFWDKYETNVTDKSNYLDATPEILPKLYKEIAGETILDVSKILNAWSQVEKPFLELTHKMFPQISYVEKISVYLTRYGTRASYSPLNNEIIVLLRQDKGIEQIGFCILASLFSKTVGNVDNNMTQEHSYTWIEKQKMLDYLMQHSAYKNLFPGYRSLIDDLRHNHMPKEISDKSAEIYTKLGFPPKLYISISNDEVYFEKQKITNLSNSEKKALHLLIKNEEQVVSFDTLAEEIWGTDSYNFYSQEAIIKIIERVRKSIKSLGINKEVIITKRKQGYIFQS